MCEQRKVFKKIKEKGRVNGYDLELAEAQMHDFITLKKDVDAVKADVQAIKTEQAVQGGKLDLIIQRLNSPVEQEREDGLVWRELKKIAKSPLGKTIIVLFIFCLGLAGQRVMELTGLIKG